MFLSKIGKIGDPQISFAIAFCMQLPIATGERELRFTEKVSFQLSKKQSIKKPEHLLRLDHSFLKN